MNLKFKKVILIIALLALAFNITAYANSAVSLTLPEGFYVHESEPGKVADILSIEENELSEYCKNNSILYLAVDSDNNRQIRITVSENGFSNSVVNISKLTDDKITELAPDIAGIEGVRGEAIGLNGQKFLKVQLKSEDSGGEYILTQYITVAQRQNIILSFYNDSDIDTEYIDGIFQTLSSPMFSNEEAEKTDDGAEKRINLLLVFVPLIAIGFLIACIGLGVSVVIDIRKNKDEEEDDYSPENGITEEQTQENQDTTEQ